jgi:hypothetical protein
MILRGRLSSCDRHAKIIPLRQASCYRAPSRKATRADFRAPASANQACQHLLPNGGLLTPAQQQQLISQGLKHAACMRTHGITKFPDPSRGDGFNLGEMQGLGIDINSPQFKSAQQACFTGSGGS